MRVVTRMPMRSDRTRWRRRLGRWVVVLVQEHASLPVTRDVGRIPPYPIEDKRSIEELQRACYTFPMDVTDRPPPPQAIVGHPEANRTSKRWAIVAAVLCPCHLWLVAGVIGFFGAGATADAIRDNRTALVLVLAPLTAIALWKAVSAGRTAVVMTRNGDTCSSVR